MPNSSSRPRTNRRERRRHSRRPSRHDGPRVRCRRRPGRPLRNTGTSWRFGTRHHCPCIDKNINTLIDRLRQITGAQTTSSIERAPLRGSPAGRSRGRCRRPPAWTPARRGSPHQGDSVRRKGALEVHLLLEAAALLHRIGELAEGVGEFDAAGVELEPLGEAPGRGRGGATGPPRRRDTRTGWSPGPSRGSGSTASTSTRE